MNISKESKEALHKISGYAPEKLKAKMVYITTSNTLGMVKRYKDGLDFNKEHENNEVSL